MNVIEKSFYLRDNVVDIARDLLGMHLCTRIKGELTTGMIIETEAYAGINDRASHAFGGRYTERNKVMYDEGGVAYVYLCYGIHSLFNVVTNKKGIPHAVLIRAIMPICGLDIMKKRFDGKYDGGLLIGPGKLTKALGIHYSHSGSDTTKKNNSSQIWLEDHKVKITKNDFLATKRIGIDYAGKDALLPYRFLLKSVKKRLKKKRGEPPLSKTLKS